MIPEDLLVLKAGCGVGDESNKERKIGRRNFLVLGLESGPTASVVVKKCNAKGGGQSGREQDASDRKREGVETEWSSERLVDLGCEAAYRRLTLPRRTRVRDKR